MTDHRRLMMEAIALAEPYLTHPNPRVGCVIVRDGDQIGSGAHRQAGGPHAETAALAEVANAGGAEAYVTLEPCDHLGRTPSCSQALIRAGVERVFVAVLDPDPRVSGSGVEALTAAGIEVNVGQCEAEAVELDLAYHHQRRHRRPYVKAFVGPNVAGAAVAVDRLHTTRSPVLDLGAALEPQLGRLGDFGVVELGLIDGELAAALDRLELLDEVVGCGPGANGALAGMVGGYTVVEGDSIGSCTIARKASHVHGNH